MCKIKCPWRDFTLVSFTHEFQTIKNLDKLYWTITRDDIACYRPVTLVSFTHEFQTIKNLDKLYWTITRDDIAGCTDSSYAPPVLTSYIFRPELTFHLYPSTSYIPPPPLPSTDILCFPPSTISLYFYPSKQLIFSPVPYIHFIFSPVLTSYIFSLVLTSYIFCSELTAYILCLVGKTAGQYRLKKYDFKKSSPGVKRRNFFAKEFRSQQLEYHRKKQKEIGT